MSLPDTVAVVGCGVIGGGWAARFALNGVDVKVADPAPGAAHRLATVEANAVRAWQALGLPTEGAGAITVVDSIADAVAGAELIQESVPERLPVKRAVLAEIEATASPDALVASSTSGLKPTDLQADMTRPERLVVGHPFNPVYLLPLVEVVGGEATRPATVERVIATYAAAGMKPLHVRVEIEAFIADRLLEAMWREGLWLIRDGIATTAEIDDAIRYGFGLRWAQMGMYETYRIAGGPDGMRHFLAQFGETAHWPWSKLTNVPDLDDALVERISAQSDAQSGHRSIDELERIRDDNLVAILLALESTGHGAGAVVADLRAGLADT